MKKISTILAMSILLLTSKAFAQTSFKEIKAGHIFNVSLPDYMSRTAGLNSAATIQFKSTVKDVYGFVIEDSKEELKLAEIHYTSLTEFYDDQMKDFLVDEEKRKVSKPVSKKVGTTNFMECDASYFDKDAQTQIYYFVGIAETPTTYYKVFCWGVLANKDKFKADFQKILYSIKD